MCTLVSTDAVSREAFSLAFKKRKKKTVPLTFEECLCSMCFGKRDQRFDVYLRRVFALSFFFFLILFLVAWIHLIGLAFFACLFSLK